MKHITSSTGTLPGRSPFKSPATRHRGSQYAPLFSSLPRSYKTGLIAALLLASACFPPAIFADEYSATSWVVYVAANSSNDLLATSSPDPTDGWTGSVPVTGQQSPFAPALTGFDGHFVLAYVANNSSNDLLVTTSTNGVTWKPSTLVTGQSSGHGPALTVFDKKLVLAYVANNGSNDLLVTTSTDGITWTPSASVTGQQSGLTPALTVFDKKLVLAYVANNSSNDLLVTTSTNGVTWTPSASVTGQQSGLTPAVSIIPNPIDSPNPPKVYNLIMVYVANNGSDDLLVTTSADGVTWTPSARVTGQSSRVAPTLRIIESRSTP